MISEHITIDFETRSPVDISQAGAWVYSRDPRTEILCLAFLLPGDDPEFPSLWHPGWRGAQALAESPHTLDELFECIALGYPVEAHNAFFERCIWEHIARRPPPEDELGILDWRRGMNAPPIHETQWRCSAAKAATYGLPRDLGGACAVMLDEGEGKDTEGRKIMLRMCSPRPPRKHESCDYIYYHDDEESFLRLYAYCQRDVTAEFKLSAALPDLSPYELRVWQADQRANWRGIRVDQELCRAAIALETVIKEDACKELRALTGGAVEKGSQRARALAWLKSQNFALPDTQAATLDNVLASDHYAVASAAVRRVVRIIRDINRTSTSKYKRILTMCDAEDSRVRDLMRYHGATTGRWAGQGIQPQNFPRGKLADFGLSMEEACALIKRRDMRAFKGDWLQLLSSALRGALIPSDGKLFVGADYSAIEARLLLWLANDPGLQIFARGGDIYCEMASGIYRRPVTKADKRERHFGKQAVLGLGYGAGFVAFLLLLRRSGVRFTREEVLSILGDQAQRYSVYVDRALNPKLEYFLRAENPKVAFGVAKMYAAKARRALAAAHIDPADVVYELMLAKYVVDTYRTKFAEVPALWKAQETAAKRAIRSPGARFREGRIVWERDSRWLRAILPSGRALHYMHPSLKPRPSWNGTVEHGIHYEGVIKKTKKWGSMHTYGASIVENLIQAIARDIMADSFVRADDPVLTVHDELLCEVDDWLADAVSFEQHMIDLPLIYAGCPLAAEGDVMTRYQK